MDYVIFGRQRCAEPSAGIRYSETDFEVFCPTEATRCTDGGDEGPKVDFSMRNFTATGATIRAHDVAK